MSGAANLPYDAVLLIGFGGPGAPEEIRPFLDRVLRGRPVPRERYEEVVHHYETMGGRSPYNELTRRLADGLHRALQRRGLDLPVLIGLRNAAPSIEEAITALARHNSRRVLGFILSAFRCEASWERYQDEVTRACAEIGPSAPTIIYPNPWHCDLRFVAAAADRVRTTMTRMRTLDRATAELIFTAHSIPLAMDGRRIYVRQLRESASLVAQAVDRENWRLAFQSRSGSPGDPWLEPDIREAIVSNERPKIVIPIGFLCDHVEVLYDLDVDVAAVARSAGITLARAATVGNHPRFIEMIAAIAAGKIAHGAPQYQPHKIVVIGGGVTGLSAAYRLRELAAAHEFPLEVILLEASNRPGGALETIRHEDCILETGADSFLSEKPAALKLAERLGLATAIVRTQEQFRKTYVVREGRLVAIPEGFSLIAPTYLGPILRSPLFSLAGKVRIMLEPLIPRRRTTKDESISHFVTRRLGCEVLERVAQPLAAGIYTADPDQLSAAATMPRFVEMERRHGSLIQGLRAAARNREAEFRGTSGARWSLFVSFRDGMSTLIDALTAKLADTVEYGAQVTAIARVESGWRIELAHGEPMAADAIICATPAAAAAHLVEPHDHALAQELRSINYASAAVVNLVFCATDFPEPPSSFGFVVPIAERRKIIAGSLSSLKFAGRAPADKIVARVFIGGALQTAMLTLDDDAMIAAAREEFRSLLGVTAAPRFTCVRRWPESMPQYTVGHLERVATIRSRAAALPGLFVAGAYLDGVGIPDCVRHGETAAEAVFTEVRNRVA